MIKTVLVPTNYASSVIVHTICFNAYLMADNELATQGLYMFMRYSH